MGGLRAASLRRMRWLYGACMETLRRYPPVSGAIPRYVAKPFSFGGYTIAARQQIFITTGVAHFLPEVYRSQSVSTLSASSPPGLSTSSRASSPLQTWPAHCFNTGMGEALIIVIMAPLLRHVEFTLPRPYYRLRTGIAPTPGPDHQFTVGMLGQRATAPHTS